MILLEKKKKESSFMETTSVCRPWVDIMVFSQQPFLESGKTGINDSFLVDYQPNNTLEMQQCYISQGPLDTLRI